MKMHLVATWPTVCKYGMGGYLLTKKLVPALKGDEYQILWFWLQVCKLFHPRTKVKAVELESNDVKGFDDVVVHYEGLIDRNGSIKNKDCFQVKFHMTGYGAITGSGLCDPSFINAEKSSLLQRLHSAYGKHAAADDCSRFTLLSPWQVHPDDVLSKVYDMTSHGIDWDRLSAGGDKSATGKLRKIWREHLGLKSDDELRPIINTLRLRQTSSLDDLRTQLNEHLAMCGLRPVEVSSYIDPYQELTRGLLKQSGNVLMTRPEVESLCKKEGLYEGPPFFSDDRKYIGVQTFSRWTDGIDDRCEAVLDLRDLFDGRQVKTGRSWAEIGGLVEKFFEQETKSGAKVDIELHAALSVCLAVGYYLPAKRRVSTAVIQPPRQRWESHPPGSTAATLFSTDFIQQPACATELALSLSVTHNVNQQVQSFISSSLCEWAHIHFLPMSGFGAMAVRDGMHAWEMAQSFCSQVKQIVVEQKYTRVHLFASAPAALMFFIGQLAHALPPITIYEYEFGSAAPVYFPSINLPATALTMR